MPSGVNNSTIVSNFNMNQSDMPGKDGIGTSRYVPRQKSRARVANTQIGLSLATTIMNLSRNEDTNMSRMLVNDMNTEADAITKPDDHFHGNLATQ